MRLGTMLSILAIAPAAICCGQPGLAASAARAAGDQTRTVNERTRTRAPAPASRSPLALAKPSGSALFNAAYHRTGNNWEQAIFLCDGVDGDRIKVVTTPNARGLSELWTYRKRDFGTSRETVRLGDEDPGAGQIMRELRRPGGVAMGSIHSINPGMAGDARATTPAHAVEHHGRERGDQMPLDAACPRALRRREADGPGDVRDERQLHLPQLRSREAGQGNRDFRQRLVEHRHSHDQRRPRPDPGGRRDL